MTYVFVFLGEFGYELLNWHGVVRKFRRLNPGTAAICCSRGDVWPLYDQGTYVDISDVPEFRESVAIGYYALAHGDLNPASDENIEFDRELRRRLRQAVNKELRAQLGARWTARRVRGVRWVFSSERSDLSGCHFGAERSLFANIPAEGDIYDLLDLRNNMFARIPAVKSCREDLERRLGLSLDDPYVLVQGRNRELGRRSEALVPEAEIMEAIAQRLPLVAVDFNTGRAGDSYSQPPGAGRARRISVSGFAEQSCLVENARACVFFTEADFGSHMYVPPLLGRDVQAIAPRSVYELGTTPIAFWNRNVFRFGGAIKPVIAEDLEDQEALRNFVDSVVQ